MKTKLSIEIECGTSHCRTKDGRFCQHIKMNEYDEPICGIFGNLTHGFGNVHRHDKCIELGGIGPDESGPIQNKEDNLGKIVELLEDIKDTIC